MTLHKMDTVNSLDDRFIGGSEEARWHLPVAWSEDERDIATLVTVISAMMLLRIIIIIIISVVLIIVYDY